MAATAAGTGTTAVGMAAIAAMAIGAGTAAIIQASASASGSTAPTTTTMGTATRPAYIYGQAPVVVASPSTNAIETADAPLLEPADGRARLQVLVPADAEVWLNGNPTTQRGEQRLFESPALAPGRDYQYEVRARWTEGGRAVDQTRTVVVRANARVGVDFSRAEPAPAPVPVPVPK